MICVVCLVHESIAGRRFCAPCRNKYMGGLRPLICVPCRQAGKGYDALEWHSTAEAANPPVAHGKLVQRAAEDGIEIYRRQVCGFCVFAAERTGT